MRRSARNPDRSAITGVLSTAIGILIFFAVIIPTWLYMQQLQTIFVDEVNRRLIFEAEKLRERVQVEPYIMYEGSGRYRLYVRITNLSPLETTVTGLYAESNVQGVISLTNNPIVLSPAESRVIRTEYLLRCQSAADCEVVLLRASTARGNSFVSPYSIGPMKPPFVLVVSLANLTASTDYDVIVSVKEGSLGCIMPPARNEIRACDKEVGVRRYVDVRSEVITSSGSVSVGREEVFYFTVAPGNYTLKVMMRDGQGRWTPITSIGDTAPIQVTGDTIVRVDARIGGPQTIILRLSSPVSRLVLFNSSDTNTPLSVNLTFFVHYDRLSSGPMINFTVGIAISSTDGAGFCSNNVVKVNGTVPGDTVPVTFSCSFGQSVPASYTIVVSINGASIEVPSSIGTFNVSGMLTQRVTLLLCHVKDATVVTEVVAHTATFAVVTYIHSIDVRTTTIRVVNCPPG
jgi:hypothetical protein